MSLFPEKSSVDILLLGAWQIDFIGLCAENVKVAL